MNYSTRTVTDTLRDLDASLNGLSASEVRERVVMYGNNTIKLPGEPLWRVILTPFIDIFVAVLLVATGISLWHQAYIDAVVIMAIIVINSAIYYVQRYTTSRVLSSLQRTDLPDTEVWRDRRLITIPSDQLVPGDIIYLAEGEKVPADVRLIETESLRINESQFTGESVPVSKNEAMLRAERETFEQTNMAFQGTFVVGGTAKAIVTATGNSTEYGRLAHLSSSNREERSPVQQKIDILIRRIVISVAAVSFLAFSLAIYRGVEFLESLRFVIALAVSAVPESLAIAISVVLVLNMRAMAKRRALVRSMRAAETIGTITTIATDKTGTLTRNILSVRDIFPGPDANKRSLSTAIARSANLTNHTSHDPLDIAFRDYAPLPKRSAGAAKLYPFDNGLAMSGALWHSGRSYELYVKGAPEQILARCDLTTREYDELMREAQSMATRGLRVIACAHTNIDDEIDTLHRLPRRQTLTLDGLVGVADTLRPEAARAIRTALNAGISVRMITGDHLETAYHIGRELGIVERREDVFDCTVLNSLSDDELDEIVERCRVFSRVKPEHKHRLLTILRRHNITAMTGDGVNDVPALTQAHIGIAMGSGTEIAKDAGDIILLNDNFKTIIDAVRQGRTTYVNIRRMVVYLIATNVGEVLVSLGALAIGLPLPLVAIQILWINLVTDTAMVIPLGLEPGDRGAMRQAPRAPTAPLISRYYLSRIIAIAVTIAVATLATYMIFLPIYGIDYARTMAFAVLVAVQWAGALGLRSDLEPLFVRMRRRNPTFYLGLAATIILQIIAFTTPLGNYLHLVPVAIGDMFIASLLGFVALIIVIELHKYIGRVWLSAETTK